MNHKEKVVIAIKAFHRAELAVAEATRDLMEQKKEFSRHEDRLVNQLANQFGAEKVMFGDRMYQVVGNDLQVTHADFAILEEKINAKGEKTVV